MKRYLYVCLLVGGLLAGCGSEVDEDGEEEEALACDDAAVSLLETCVASVNEAWRACYFEGDGPCDADDPAVVAALDQLEQGVRGSCGDGDFESLSLDGVVGRWRYACQSEADSLAWRTFGGPQGAAWAQADDDAASCLLAAHEAGSRLVQDLLSSTNACLAAEGCGRDGVDPGGERVAMAVSEVEVACADLALEDLIALTPEVYVERARQQVECLAATAHGSAPGFELECGPSSVEADLVRGEYVRIELDGDRWGTGCGDGSPYAFDIRLAPEGERLDRVIIGLQGGGVCFFDDDCSARFDSAPGLFTAVDDDPPQEGIMSNDPEVSPFANWTKVFLPYCTQDVFIGGGVVESFEALDLQRFGALNVRAAARVTRDLLWREMDAEGGDGYRPDELVALFGGWSAGSYGTLYNYHWVLDDLLWQRTAAFPDAGLGLDNGDTIGVRTFGSVLIERWNALEFLPSYCFAGDCAVGPDNFAAIAPRLRQVPEQQVLVFSNQRDQIQQRDSFFGEDESLFINTLREAYCDTKDLNGIQWYLTSESEESTHVVTIRDAFYTGEVAGIAMRDWLWGAVTEPDDVVDRAENGDFSDAVPGVEPFPCALP